MKKEFKKEKPRKIVLCMPFSPHETAQAGELVKLWCDMEPEFNKSVELLIISRFDISPYAIGKDVIEKARTKFKTYLHQCTKVGTGWPHGCNQLEVGAYDWFVRAARDGATDADFILLAETDTVPLRPGWINEIMNEAYDSGKLISGAYFVKEDGPAHINGNCAIHKDFWKVCKSIWSISPFVGWDVAIGPMALKYGHPSSLIWQDYRLDTPQNLWKGDDFLWDAKSFKNKTNPLYGKELRPCLFHGIKSGRGIAAVKKKFAK